MEENLKGAIFPAKVNENIPKAMINIHLVSFATEADGMVVSNCGKFGCWLNTSASIAQCCNLIMLSKSVPTPVVRLAAGVSYHFFLAGFCVLYSSTFALAMNHFPTGRRNLQSMFPHISC
jgi:hypothetical protein